MNQSFDDVEPDPDPDREKRNLFVNIAMVLTAITLAMFFLGVWLLPQR